MESYERIDARGVRETGRPVSFVPKGALTHHPRSGRWYCLRQPCALRGGCGSCGSLMSNATPLLSCCHWPRRRLNCFALSSKPLFPLWKQLAACPHKPATGSFICGYDPKLDFGSFSLLRKRNRKRKNEVKKIWRFIIWKRK